MLNATAVISSASPILMCEGQCRQPCRHRFDHVVDQMGVNVVVQQRLVYRCEPCGHERVWGALEPFATFHS